MRKSSSSLRGTLLLLAGSLVISLLILEIGLRLTRSFPARALHTVSQDDYERIPGMFEPGQDFLDLKEPALPHRIRINSLGFRGPEIARQPTKPRVLLIGDSFTFGDFVDDEDTLPAQVQARLEGAGDVVNGGVGGTTLSDQRVFLRRYLAIRPDAIVLIFFENDLSELLTQPPRYVSLERNRSLKSGILGFFFLRIRDTAVFNAALYLQNRIRWSPRWGREARSAGRPPDWLDEAVSRYASEAAALKEMLDAEGIELLVAAYPHPYAVRPTALRFRFDSFGPVSDALREMEIDVVDLTGPLQQSGYGIEELYLLPVDGHPSRLGYGLAADALVPHVKRMLRSVGREGENEATPAGPPLQGA